MHWDDVLIAGGGPAGLALATALARMGMHVRVARRAKGGPSQVGEVLPPAIRPALQELGVWERFAEDGHLPSAGVTFWWGGESGGEWDYIRSPYGCGWHIDRLHFETMLAQIAVAAGVECLENTTVSAAERDDGRWTCTLRADGCEFPATASFLVHAAGRAPLLRDVLGPRVRLDRLVGVARYFHQPVDASFEPRLWVEATPSGWWYTAPLPRNQMIAVFMTDHDLLSGEPAGNAAQSLYDAPNTVERLSHTTAVSPLHVRPAESSRLTRFTAHGCLAIGDASFSTDPISGRGILTAMRAVPIAANAIVDFLGGRTGALSDYEAWAEGALDAYLDGLQAHYALQDRWRDSSFWSRRAIDRRF